MIAFILRELRRQGVIIPDAVGTATMVAAHAAYGGTRYWVPRQPKQQGTTPQKHGVQVRKLQRVPSSDS